MRKLKTAIIREEYVALTGDLEKALILNQFIYWSERINDFDNFIKEEKSRRENENLDDVNLELQSGWIYKDMSELKDEIMITSSVSTISRKLNDMVDSGWLLRRTNPKYRWDKRYQYRVDLLKVAVDLYNIGYILQNYKVNIVEMLNLSILQNANTNLHENTTPNSNGEMSNLSNLQNENTKSQNDDSNLHHAKAISEITTKTTTKTTTEITNISVCLDDEEYIDKDRLEYIDKVIKNKGFKPYDQVIYELNLREDIIEYPYSKWIDAAKKAVWEMYYNESTKVSGKKISRFQVVSKLQKLNHDMAYTAIRNVAENSKTQEIVRPVAFLKAAIFNEIDEFEAKINARVNYDINN